MLYLSQAIGRPVLDRVGEPIGTRRRSHRRRRRALSARDRARPRDRSAPDLPALVVRRDTRRGRRAGCARRRSTSRASDSVPNEILLRADLMDKQIVDIDGRKVVRVNDLRLDEVEGSLRLVAVDVGAAGLLRRLGIEGGVPDDRPRHRPARPGALHRLGGRRPGRDLDRVDQAAGAPPGPRRAPPGRPGHDHRPARPA